MKLVFQRSSFRKGLRTLCQRSRLAGCNRGYRIHSHHLSDGRARVMRKNAAWTLISPSNFSFGMVSKSPVVDLTLSHAMCHYWRVVFWIHYKATMNTENQCAHSPSIAHCRLRCIEASCWILAFSATTIDVYFRGDTGGGVSPHLGEIVAAKLWARPSFKGPRDISTSTRVCTSIRYSWWRHRSMDCRLRRISFVFRNIWSRELICKYSLLRFPYRNPPTRPAGSVSKLLSVDAFNEFILFDHFIDWSYTTIPYVWTFTCGRTDLWRIRNQGNIFDIFYVPLGMLTTK